MAIVIKLQELLNQSSLSMDDLCNSTNLSPTLIQGLLSDPTKTVTTESLNRLCTGLGVTPDEILEFIPDDKFQRSVYSGASPKVIDVDGLGLVRFEYMVETVRTVRATLVNSPEFSTGFVGSERRALAGLRLSRKGVEDIVLDIDGEKVPLVIRETSQGFRGRWDDEFWLSWRYHKPEILVENPYRVFATKEEILSVLEDRLREKIPMHLDEKEVKIRQQEAKRSVAA